MWHAPLHGSGLSKEGKKEEGEKRKEEGWGAVVAIC